MTTRSGIEGVRSTTQQGSAEHDHDTDHALKDALLALRGEVLAAEDRLAGPLGRLSGAQRASARNLVHYLELRRHDLRDLQVRLAERGLSSLGRSEAYCLAAIEAVLGRLGAQEGPAGGLGFTESRRVLEGRTDALLGQAVPGRRPRIMVTAPSDAATEPEILERLLAAGMDCLRINCAHDSPEIWEATVGNLRLAEERLGRRCRIEVDTPGPHLRTGALGPGPAVLKLRPHRDEVGRTIAPARVWLTAQELVTPAETADGVIPVPAAWLGRRRAGERVVIRDARGSRRVLTLEEPGEGGRWAALDRTAYVVEGTLLWPAADAEDVGRVGTLPRREQRIRLRTGDTLTLTRDPHRGDPERRAIPCTLAEAFDAVSVGDPIWFDDGRLGGVVEDVSPGEILVRVTQAGPNGASLRPEKGINLPETDLRLPAITASDEAAIAFAARHADLLGLSFVNAPGELRAVREILREHGAGEMGVVLKIETKRAFAALPELLLAGLEEQAPIGVMIARGDLAIECGYERLAEVQEEILWLAEAAHVPVIWATQVLEGLAKNGRPSRAEITDAAMGARAECVMLNKGPWIVEAMTALDDILVRMSAHHDKKRSLLRELRSFRGEPR